MEYLIGTDPEVFVRNMKTGRFVSAHGMVAGTKEKPEPVEAGALQVDGMALEFNITPASSAAEFDTNIGRVIEQLKERVFAISKDYALVFRPFANFDPDYFESEVPIEAKILGCDPDFNAFTGKINPNPGDVLMNQPWRTAAGHVHIGWTKDEETTQDTGHFADCRFIAERFAYSHVFDPKEMDEMQRLQHYGMNGSFRPKKYGVELRSPSNLWVADSKSRIKMFDTIIHQMSRLEKK